MSQSGNFAFGAIPPTVILTLTGNAGGPVGPSGGNINIDGIAPLTVNGTPLTHTLDISLTNGTNGQVLIGGGAGPAWASLTSSASTLTYTPGANTLNIDITAPVAIAYGGTNAITFATTDGTVYYDGTRLVTTTTGSSGQVLTSNGIGFAPAYASLPAATTFTGNVGPAEAPSGGNFNIVTFGTNVLFHGSAATQTLDFNQSNILLGTPGAITSGTDNTALGLIAGAHLTSGSDNTAIGYESMVNATTGSNSTAVGSFSMFNATIGASNNTALGYNALSTITTGTYNTCVGQNAGLSLATTDSSNICIGHAGIAGNTNTMRLGTTGAGNGQVNKCYLAGVDGVNVGSVAKVLTMASEQVGTATLTPGTGISITPGANTITIAATGTTNLTYTPVNTTPYVVLTTDEYISVDSSGGAITIQLPNAATLDRVFIIKDRTGSAASFNITVTTVGGAVNIDGATSFIMNTNYEAINVIGNGSTYEVY